MRQLELFEHNLRLLFERLGAKLDSLVGGSDQQNGSVRSALGRFSPQLQRVIDKSLKDDEQGNSCLAPHCLRVLLDYETFSKFSQPGLRKLQQELSIFAEQYINDRRYKLSQPLNLTVTYDPIVSSPVVRADFGEIARVQLTSATDAINDSSSIYRLQSVSGPLAFSIDLKDLKKGGNPVTIGRAGDNTVHLDDKSVSKFHATLAVDPEGNVILADCGSTNGTFVNDRSVDGRVKVTSGDLLGFGDIRLRFERVR
jgi:hypothetical protein